MGSFALLLILCLFYEVARAEDTIHNLDDIFKTSVGEALSTTIDDVDLSDLTVKFVGKVQYGEPEEINDLIVDTLTEEYDNPSDEATTEEYENTYDHDNQITWELQEGLLASTMPKVQASLTGKKGFDINAIITAEDQNQQSKVTTKTLTKKSKVKVPPHSKITVAWNIIEKEVAVPWEVELEITGNLKLTCDRKCSKPKSIDWLVRRNKLPEDVFKIDKNSLRFVAKGVLVTVLGYSDSLKIETEATEEAETTEGEETETTEGEETESTEAEEPEIEEEPTEDDVAVADEDPKLTFVKGILSIASDNLDSESEWQPWIKMAGGIAELSAGNTDDPQVYLDIAESALDIVNSEQGQNILEKLGNMTKRVVNKVRGKAKTENDKCKPTGGKRKRRQPGCPSRKQPATPKPSQGQQPGRPNNRPRPRPRPTKKPSTHGKPGTTRSPRPRRTPVPRITTRPTGRKPVTTRKNKTTKKHTTRRPTTKRPTTRKTTKKRTTKRAPERRTTKRRRSG